jgi:hypothetical protein
VDIDTEHLRMGMRVQVKLETAQELALTDDELAAICLNQHRLKWIDGTSGKVSIVGLQPAKLVRPKRWWRFNVHRTRAPTDGDVARCVLLFEPPAD